MTHRHFDGLDGMMYEIKTEKKFLRKKYSEIRETIKTDPERKTLFDRKICDSIISLATFRFADIILTYYPVKSEVDVAYVTEYALSSGKKAAFPKCRTDNCTMKFYEVQSLDLLAPGAYGIPEPSDDLPEIDILNLNCKAENRFAEDKTTFFANDTVICRHILCIVPGLAFDSEGYRLGYGKGFYDRYLSKYKSVLSSGMHKSAASNISLTVVGVAYSNCVPNRLPHGKYDLPADILVTEKGVKLINAN